MNSFQFKRLGKFVLFMLEYKAKHENFKTFSFNLAEATAIILSNCGHVLLYRCPESP